MFGASLIVFRETLEAALFVGILAAATTSVANRSRWLFMGVGLGGLGSILLAAAMGQISAWASGLGQEVVTATILGVALLMLAWHTIWVSVHAREMTQDARRLGGATSGDMGSLWALAIAVAMTVLREGAETVLFVAGLISGANESTTTLATAVAVGLGLGAIAGWLIYRGLGKVSPRHLFGVTNVLILLLAGSLASQLARTFQQAGWFEWLSESAWDSSALLSNDSLLGLFLHGLLGYDASPSQLQVVFYLLASTSIGYAARQIRMRGVRI